MRESKTRIEPIQDAELNLVCGGLAMVPFVGGPMTSCGCHNSNPGAGNMEQNPPTSPNREELESDW